MSEDEEGEGDPDNVKWKTNQGSDLAGFVRKNIQYTSDWLYEVFMNTVSSEKGGEPLLVMEEYNRQQDSKSC